MAEITENVNIPGTIETETEVDVPGTIETETEVEIPETVEMTRDVQPGWDFEVQVTVDVSDTASAHQAEAWAVGRRGGVPVSSTDETYHNNAEYYARVAAQPVVALVAPDYSELTFPIEANTKCTYEGKYYYAKQKINSQEAFDSTHWQETTVSADLDKKADKTDPKFTGSISLGRKANTTVGANSSAVGYNVEASGDYSHSEGRTVKATGYVSHAEGSNTTASGQYAHAEGYNTTASDDEAHAEGYSTTASGTNAHAEGYSTTASGYSSHAEGSQATASGQYAHAEGNKTTASGSYSHAEGNNTTANHRSQSVGGEFNVADPSSDSGTSRGNYAEIIGNGLANNSRSNARTLDWNGNERLAGDLYVQCENDSSGGSKVVSEASLATALSAMIATIAQTQAIIDEYGT